MKSYRDLMVWQKAVAVASDVYAMAAGFPASERYALSDQVKRAAVSVPSNIAEGYGRQSKRDYLRYLQIARGSLYELETQIEIARNLGFCEAHPSEGLIEKTSEISRMLSALISRIRDSENNNTNRISEQPESDYADPGACETDACAT